MITPGDRALRPPRPRDHRRHPAARPRQAPRRVPHRPGNGGMAPSASVGAERKPPTASGLAAGPDDEGQRRRGPSDPRHAEERPLARGCQPTLSTDTLSLVEPGGRTGAATPIDRREAATKIPPEAGPRSASSFGATATAIARFSLTAVAAPLVHLGFRRGAAVTDAARAARCRMATLLSRAPPTGALRGWITSMAPGPCSRRREARLQQRRTGRSHSCPALR